MMNSKKNILFTILFITVPYVLLSQSTQNLLFVAPVLSETINPAESRLLEDKLVAGLLSTGYFNVIADSESRIDKSKIDTAMQRAQEKKIDYVLFSNIIAEGKTGPTRSYTISIRLVAVETNMDLLSHTVKFQQKDADAKINDVSKRITVSAKARNDVTLEMVDTFIRAKDWETAKRYLDILQKSKPDLKDIGDRKIIINNNLAIKKFSQAQEAVASYLYDEGRKAIKEAIDLDPNNEMYAKYAEKIEEEYILYLQKNNETKLKEIEDLLKKDRLFVAMSLFDRLPETAKNSKQGIAINGIIKRKEQAKKNALQAAEYLKLERYVEATNLINEAILLDPDSPDYIKLRTKILDEERKYSLLQERWNAYREELEKYDYKSIFIARRNLPYGLAFSAGALNISYFDPSRKNWNEVKKGAFPFIEVEYNNKFDWSMMGPYSFTQIGCGYWVSFGGSSGTERNNSSYPGALLVAESYRDIWLSSGLDGHFEALATALKTNIGLELGYHGNSFEHRDSYGTVIANEDFNLFMLSFIIQFDFTVIYSKDMALGLIWKSSIPMVASSSINDGTPKKELIGISFRRGL